MDVIIELCFCFVHFFLFNKVVKKSAFTYLHILLGFHISGYHGHLTSSNCVVDSRWLGELSRQPRRDYSL